MSIVIITSDSDITSSTIMLILRLGVRIINTTQEVIRNILYAIRFSNIDLELAWLCSHSSVLKSVLITPTFETVTVTRLHFKFYIITT